MTIDEAMADLSIQMQVKRTLGFDQQADAIKLGIEALKREQQWRQRWPHQSHLPFPGETEE